MRKHGRPLGGAWTLGLVLWLSGCPSTPETSDAPPPESSNGSVLESEAPAHASLQAVVERAERALGQAAGASGTPEFQTLLEAATDLEAGLERIRRDRPGTDAARYERLEGELGQSITALEHAAQQQDALAVRRAFHRVSAACVRCHVESGAR